MIWWMDASVVHMVNGVIDWYRRRQTSGEPCHIIINVLRIQGRYYSR
jgi:hypothetical protein